jgi:MFS family permease
VDTARAWIGVTVLWLFYVLALMDRGAIALMVAPIMHDLSISIVQMGILQGFAFASLYVLAGAPLGWATDHISRHKLLIAGITVWSLATIACGFARSYLDMVLARAVVGAGEAVLIPTGLSLIAELFSRPRVGTATAVFSSGATIGSGAALMIGGVLLQRFQSGDGSILGLGHLAPWRGVFIAFGITGACAAWLSLLIPRPSPAKDSGHPPGQQVASAREFGRFLWKQRMLLTYVLLAFPLLLAGMMAFMAWAPRHAQVAFHWDIRKVGLVIGALKVVATPLGVIFGGVLMDRALRHDIRAPYFTVPLVATAVGGPLLAAGMMQADGTIATVLLTLGMFVYSAYGSAHYVILQILAPPSMRGRLIGVYVIAMTLIGTGLGALLPPILTTLASSGSKDLGTATAYVFLGITVIVVLLLAAGRSRLQAALTESRAQSIGSEFQGVQRI